jgi:hypothetical protein
VSGERPCCECGNCSGTDPENSLPVGAWAVAGLGDVARLAVLPAHASYYDDERHELEAHDGWVAVGARRPGEGP